jgi:hypothetical protein
MTDGLREWTAMPKSFVDSIVGSAGHRLRRFEVHNVIIPIAAVEALCEGAIGLVHVVVHVWECHELDRLADALSRLTELRTLHILCQRTDMSMDKMLTLAERYIFPLNQMSRSMMKGTEPNWHQMRSYSQTSWISKSVRLV